MHTTLVVLAAGIGSRYGGLKQLDPVGPSGEFIIDYAVFDAVRAGFDNVVFVIRRDIEQAFRHTIGTRIEAHVATQYVFQELAAMPDGFTLPSERVKPWGTGHAVLACADAVGAPFAVINADDFYGRESYEVLGRFLDETRDDPSRYGMVAFRLDNTLSEHGSVARGVCATDAGGCLTSVTELTRIERLHGEIRCGDHALTGSEPVSLNFWGFKPSVFGHLEREFAAFLGASGTDLKAEFFMPSVVNTLVEAGEASVAVLQTGSVWFGATYPDDKPIVVARVRELVAAGEYPENLWA